MLLHYEDNGTVNKLPKEVFHRIFGYLSGLELARCSFVSQYWNNLVNYDGLWNHLFHTEISKWDWVDRSLVDLLEYASGPSGELVANVNLKDAYMKRDRSTSAFHELWSAYPFSGPSEGADCIILGPAADTAGLYGGLLQTLLNAMDIGATTLWKNRPASGRTEVPGWSGQGFAIRLPMSTTNSQAGEALLHVNFLHARNEITRQGLLFGGSRIHNSLLVLEAAQQSSHVQLSPEMEQILKCADIVVYAVDARRLSADVTRFVDSAIDDPQLKQASEDHWSEVRCELAAVIEQLSADQVLLLLGISDKNRSDEETMTPMQIVSKLGNLQSGEASLLNNVKATWRVWCTRAVNGSYSNVSELLGWAFIEARSKKQRGHFSQMTLASSPFNRKKSNSVLRTNHFFNF